MKKNRPKPGIANGPSTPGIRLPFAHPTAAMACVAGTFNDWRPEATPMVSIGDGRWMKELTLPLESDASRRAGRVLRERGLVSAPELAGVGEVLHAAAWTYIAAFTVTFAQLLRLLPWGRWVRLLF